MVRLVLFLLLAAIASQANVYCQNQASPSTLRWNKGRGYQPFRNASGEGIEIDNQSSTPISDNFLLPVPSASFSLSFRAANRHAHPGKRFPYLDKDGRQKRVSMPAWDAILKFSPEDSISVRIASVEQATSVSSQNGIEISILNSEGEAISKKFISGNEDIDCYTGFNSWTLSGSENGLEIWGGARSLSLLLHADMTLPPCSGFGFSAHPAADLMIKDISFSDNSPVSMSIFHSWKGADELDAYLKKSKDPLEGYWSLFDRDLEESLLLMGGDYRCAIVRDADRYLLLYLSGARVNAKKWRQGMVKAILTPDLFSGIFNVEWIDAEGNSLSNSIKAQTGEGNTLSLQFPYHNSSLRLRKHP
ncbi:MAG: hypothetical protein K2J82_06375 [Muribaculaceae bacterium]|nr:hypothetical protein [Muribaculaceae bacterium]MDE6754219.1 hypothetical protein [Muribaculaceae bacterium]